MVSFFGLAGKFREKLFRVLIRLGAVIREKGFFRLANVELSETVFSAFSAGTELDCIDSFEASESLFLGSESFAFESCSANSFANSALVSSTLGMRALEPFLLIGIVQNNNNGSFWNFVLIRSEIDKGPFGG